MTDQQGGGFVFDGFWQFGPEGVVNLGEQFAWCTAVSRRILAHAGYDGPDGPDRAEIEGNFKLGSVESLALMIGREAATARLLLEHAAEPEGRFDADVVMIISRACYLAGYLQAVLTSKGGGLTAAAAIGLRDERQRANARADKSTAAEKRNAPIIALARAIQAGPGTCSSLSACAKAILGVIARDDAYAAFRPKDDSAIRGLLKTANPPLFVKIAGRNEWRPVRSGDH